MRIGVVEVLVLINLQPGKARGQDDKAQQHADMGAAAIIGQFVVFFQPLHFFLVDAADVADHMGGDFLEGIIGTAVL